MEEVEAKFVLMDAQSADLALRVLAGHCDLHALGETEQLDDYLDDKKRRIGQAGWTCRIRTKNSEEYSIQLKSKDILGGDSVFVREEIEQPLFHEPGLPLRANDLAEGDVRSLLEGWQAGRLRQQVRIATKRANYRAVSPNGCEFEVCVDRCAVFARGREVLDRFCELELELVSGTESHLRALSEQLQQAGFQRSRLSKYQRAAWSAGASRPPKVRGLADTDSAGELMLRQLNRWMARVAHYGKLAEEGQPRGVHLMRTNIRRIRAALKAAEPELGDSGRHFSSLLGELARGVGGLRDLDVFVAHIDQRLDALADIDDRGRRLLVTRLRAGHVQAREVASRALLGLPSVFSEWQQLEQQRFHGSWPDVQTFATRMLIKRWRQLRRRGRKLHANSPDAELHAVRLAAKRFRYALELVTPVYGEQAKGYARMATALQEIFGAHQDACVAIGVLRQTGEEMPVDGHSREALVLLGRILQDQYVQADATRADALAAWERFARVVRTRDIRRLC